MKTENGGGIANFYNYDANGNRTSKNSNTDFETYAYDDADKLLSVTRVTHASTSYTYDACGRPTNIGSRVLNWDYEDRLTNINSGGVPTTNYGYNGVGSRVTKSNTNGSRSYKRNGVGVTAPVLSDGVATMVPGISEKSTGVGTNTILTDRLGSMKGMANGGNVTETAEFDAFGKVVAHGNPSATQKGFASGFGYQEDGESGYKLLGHRYYDPETGRFLSRDPAFDGRNWYAYCVNNPLHYADPSGLKPGDKFNTPQEAANDAAKYAGKQSIDEGVEYGGLVYETEDGKFSYDVHKADANNRFGGKGFETKEVDSWKAPKKCKYVGIWHIHPLKEGTKFDLPNDRVGVALNPSQPSEGDKGYYRSFAKKHAGEMSAKFPLGQHFIVTPNGVVLVINPKKDGALDVEPGGFAIFDPGGKVKIGGGGRR